MYVVTAYRWGLRNAHSYVVGVRSTEEAAIRLAQNEVDDRGGKYGAEITRHADDDQIAVVHYIECPHFGHAGIGDTCQPCAAGKMPWKAKRDGFTIAQVAVWLASRWQAAAGMAKQRAIAELEADLRDPEIGLAAHAKGGGEFSPHVGHTLRTTWQTLQERVMWLFRRKWGDIEAGRIPATPQDHGVATRHKRDDVRAVWSGLTQGWDTPVRLLPVCLKMARTESCMEADAL